MKLAISTFYVIFTLLIPVDGHVPEYLSTPASRVDQHCKLAENCFHDTIPVCGILDTEKRSFLDICDLLEYACDTNRIYSHIDDTPDCPVFVDKSKNHRF